MVRSAADEHDPCWWFRKAVDTMPQRKGDKAIKLHNQRKSSLEVLLSDFVRELQTPLDSQAHEVFLRCADRISRQARASAQARRATVLDSPPNLFANQHPTKCE